MTELYWWQLKLCLILMCTVELLSHCCNYMLDFKKKTYLEFTPGSIVNVQREANFQKSDSNDEIQQQVLVVHHDTRKAPKSKCIEFHMSLNLTQKPA